MDGAADLLALLPEVQEALCDEFDAIECSIGPGPDLSQSPFRLEVPHLGREITYVPDVTNLDGFSDSGLHRINLSKSSALFTDGHPSCCLELVLGKGRNWRDALTKLFDRMYPNKWAFFIVELEQSQPSYHLLCCNAPIVTARREDTPDSTEASSQLSSPPDSVAENSNFSLWIVPVTRVFAVPPPLPAKKKVVKKVIKKRTPNEDVYDENGEKKKLIKAVRKKLEKNDDLSSLETKGVYTNGSSAITDETPASSEKTTENLSTNTSSSPVNGVRPSLYASNLAEDMENSSINDLRKKLMSSESTSGANIEWKSTTASRLLLRRHSMTPEKKLDPIYEGKDRKERSATPLPTHKQETVSRANGNPFEVPVLCLQLIFGKYFSYEELGLLRAVHPHWDEICGQLLNAAYYRLLDRSDKLLMTLQRQLPANPRLHFPTTMLTSIQVHILNPVDVMRAVLDEGVCCFPYGAILDKTNALLDQIELMLHGGDQDTVKWEPVALLAKKAALHYRTYMERIMEERLGEGLRLKAAQRILRLDSFLVESTVTKLEKDTCKARDELKWELEQLQQQNAQLRKDNRQLKADHMRLETRVEVLEQKFKTLARLLG